MMRFGIVGLWRLVLNFIWLPRAPEPSKALPETHGLIFPKSQPIPSHGDPIHTQTITILHLLYVLHRKYVVRNPHNSTFTKSLASGMHLSFRLSIKLVGLP